MGRSMKDRSLVDFAEDFRILSARGFTHREIAEAMGYKSGRTVSRLVCRARSRRLLPPAGQSLGPLPADAVRSPRMRLADFVEDLAALQRRGLTHEQIAQKLGYANGKAVSNTLYRARRHRLASPPLHGTGCTCGLRTVTR